MIKKIILLSCFFIGILQATTVSTDKTTYTPSETIKASYTGMSGDREDWIAIYKAGDSNDWANVINWQWIRGKKIGNETFHKLPLGKYEIRVFFNNTFKTEATRSFSVANSKTTVTTDKSSYTQNETITASFTGMSGDRKDWIAIYKAADSNDWGNVISWEWIRGKKTGNETFHKLPLGEYEVRVFFNNTFKTEATKSFSVLNSKTTVTTDKSSYTPHETITASFTGMSGDKEDWIAIYKAGKSNDWENVIDWEWIRGKKEGSETFDTLPTGNYEVRVFFNNSYQTESTKAFSVKKSSTIKDIKLSSFPDGDRFVTINKATFNLAGQVTADNIELYTKIYSNNQLLETKNIEINNFKFNQMIKLTPNINSYSIKLFAKIDGKEYLVKELKNLTIGDIYIIQGQSNAVAYVGDPLEISNEHIKSFGSAARTAPYVKDDLTWYTAQANNQNYQDNAHGFIGKWGMAMANSLVEDLNMPLIVLNGALGGSRIDQHFRDNNNPQNLNTIYGRLLYRAKHAGIADGVRILFWYQGENDGSVHTTIATYKSRFRKLYNSWKQDYKNLEKIYMFQVRAGCGNPILMMEAQRQIANEYNDIEILSTTGTEATHDGCHYSVDGYVELGNRMKRMVKDDFYHIPQEEAFAPEIESIQFENNNRNSIILKLKKSQILEIAGNPKKDFKIQNSNVTVTAISILNNQKIKLTLSSSIPNDAKISYIGHSRSDNNWIQNANEIALLSFYAVAIK